jgi:hypothetical protein
MNGKRKTAHFVSHSLQPASAEDLEGKQMLLHYTGDDPDGQIVAWFKQQLKTIGTLWDAHLPEAVLTILYSSIDTFGLLAAPAGVLDATGDTFMAWCEKYILPRLQTVDGTPITSTDLWAARCGVLHTSTPLSRLERAGKARQVFYHFKQLIGINMILNAQQMPIRIDIGTLAVAFKDGGIAFITDLNNEAARFKTADNRAQHFLRWGTAVGQSVQEP